MTESFKKLMRQQLQEKLDQFAGLVKLPIPKQGWIRTVRQALGISSYALSKKLGCSQANIIAIEGREKRGTISLKTLEQVAKAMDCKLVYSLIPIKPFDQILEDQARSVARKQVRLVNHSMSLEQQGLTASQLKQQEDNLVKELLQGNPKKLWIG